MSVNLPGRDPRRWTVETASAVKEFFACRRKHVVYFAGYGELGYQLDGQVRRVASQVLADWPSSGVLVLSGTLLRAGGLNGIADVYRLAKELGIESAGIHPSVAMEYASTHRVSPDCDHVFFVEDPTWGGFLEGTETPSATLQLHLEVSHEVVVIGGGKHAADELRASVLRGKRVRYFPAEMNHAVAQEWSARAGAEIRDVRGAAHTVWEELQSPSRTALIRP